MNARRAGGFANRPLTSIRWPAMGRAGCSSATNPYSTVIIAPSVAPGSALRASTRETAAMLASASPRNPSDSMRPSSAMLESFEVAWRMKASGRSTGGIPAPSSNTRMRSMPAPWTSIVMCSAPASRLFSTRSLTTDAGRSTTSPAAMASATAWSRRTMPISRPPSGVRGTERLEPGKLVQRFEGAEALDLDVSQLPDDWVRAPHRQAQLISNPGPPRQRPRLFERPKHLAGTCRDAGWQACDFRDVDAVAAVGSAWHDAVEEGDAATDLADLDAVVAKPG